MIQLKNFIKRSFPVLTVLGLCVAISLSSCREESGCTNRTSDNYNPDAVRDDGSCLSARDKFLGVYSILHIQWNGAVRDSFPNFENPTPRFMTVAEDELREPKDDIKLLNFGKDSLTVRALVDKNFITIPQQSLNARGLPMKFTGEGHIDNDGYLTILYTTSFIQTGQVDCEDCVIFAQRIDN